MLPSLKRETGQTSIVSEVHGAHLSSPEANDEWSVHMDTS